MSALDVLIPIGKAVGELIAAGIFAEEQREAAIDALVGSMAPTPGHAAPTYWDKRRKLLSDADELPHDTEPPPRAA